MIKHLANTILPKRLIHLLLPFYYLFKKKSSYSQEGEDMVLNKILESNPRGFYVDVGAHHPVRFSNTFHFYKLGWRGINIDAMPGSMRLFKLIRPRDINLELPISNQNHVLEYHIFNEPALNGFSKELSEIRNKDDKNFRIIKTISLKTHTLKEVLDTHLPKDQKISFLSIDVEGLDLEVLKSNDWSIYRPQYIVIEIYHLDFNNLNHSDVYNFLKSKNYELISKCVYSCIFKEN